MRFDEYRGFDGVGLAELVARGDVTASELLELAIERAEAVNPELNALVIPAYERARERARRITPGGVLGGVPMLVKDLSQEMAGVAHTSGNAALKNSGHVETQDATIVQRWEAAGLVPFGRTNSPEFGAKGVTEPVAWGATRNPWNRTRTPGGSSGGSAAMVAAGVVPIAGANDGGGSIRIPAAYTGLFGLKPGFGRTPWGPYFKGNVGALAVNHVLTRSVRDSAAVLDASHGWEPGAGVRLAAPEYSYLAQLQRPPGKLRIAFSLRSPLDTPVHADAVAAVENTVSILQGLGHEVVPAEPDIDGMQMMGDWLQLWFAQCAATVDQVRASTGCKDSGFEPDTLVMAAFGRSLRANELVEGEFRRQQYQLRYAEFLQRFDLWLTPTVAHPAARIGELATPAWQQLASRTMIKVGASRTVLRSGVLDTMARENLSFTPFTQLMNLTGVPAMSVPLHTGTDGVPLGVQFAGQHGDEGLLLQLAAQLEQAQPWQHRMPPA